MSSSSKDECSICESPFDAKDDLVITECLHTFHRACAQKRVDERKRTDCHICHKDSALDEALRREPATTNKICSICEDAWYPKEDLVMTSCHHVFHRACAQKRLDAKKKTDCHICHKDSALSDALLRQEISHPMAQQTISARSNRFVNNNISELQQANRTPISGYEDVPFMSLEEAVESIDRFVPHVKDYADRAKARCTKNFVLSDNESAAIYLYTMTTPFNEAFNKALRRENPQALAPWLGFLKLFIKALEKLPSCSATVVWRGVKGNIGSDFRVNSTHTWWSINSCSPQIDVAECFAGVKGSLFCINPIDGKDITAYAVNRDEDEIVLKPGTCLRVQSTAIHENGYFMVQLNEW